MPLSDVAAEKAGIRRRIWRRLEQAGAVRFPYGSGRIPNFAGASKAAEMLASLPEWQAARVLKCNPDYAQMPVRRLALRQGKLVYMAVPRLRGEKPFIELDPARLSGRESQAATIAGTERLGRLVPPSELRPIDAVICGAVAVSEDGSRLGKGGGFSDLEFAVVAALGLIRPATPVMTTVHELQVVDAVPMLPHDLRLTHFATPSHLVRCSGGERRLPLLEPELLNAEQRAEIAILRTLTG